MENTTNEQDEVKKVEETTPQPNQYATEDGKEAKPETGKDEGRTHSDAFDDTFA